MPNYNHTGTALEQLRDMANEVDKLIITCQGLAIQIKGLMQGAINEKAGAVSEEEEGVWGNCLNCQCHTCSRLEKECMECREGITNKNACPCDGCEEGKQFKPKDGPECPNYKK